MMATNTSRAVDASESERQYSIFVHGFLAHQSVLQLIIADFGSAVKVRPASISGYVSQYDISVERLVLQFRHDSTVEGCAVEFDRKAIFDRFAAICRGEFQTVEGFFGDGTKISLSCFNVVGAKDEIIVGPPLSPSFAEKVIALYLEDLHVAGDYPLDRIWKGALLACVQACSEQTYQDRTTEKNLAQEIVKRDAIFRGYLRVDDLLLSVANSGSGEKVVRRSVASWGDMVFVLPYDPTNRLVLLVEQFRPGKYIREGGGGLCVGPVGGRCDREESTSQTARREAFEEAGVQIGRLENVPGYYSSPGLSAEFVYGFVGEANLDGIGGQFGNEWEGERIRSFCLGVDEAINLLESGGISVSHGLVALLFLSKYEGDIRTKWLSN